METAITAERVFRKHAEAHALPPLGDEQSLGDYVEKHGSGEELTRRLRGAVDAASVGDHTECAHWCAQARQLLPKKA